MRAAHQLLEPAPRIFDDPIALAFLTPAERRLLTNGPSCSDTPAARQARAHVALRSRYTEDRLEIAAMDAVTQYIVLGAGFDTFAARQPAWARRLQIVEVDHPTTQAKKRDWLHRQGIAALDNIRYAGIDFERESLFDGLHRCGVPFEQPTFFSWLGVTMYLTRAAIADTLTTVLRFPRGSEIVLTFAPTTAVRTETLPGSRQAEGAARMGEPWITFFEPDEIVAMLCGLGLRNIEIITQGQVADLYFGGREHRLSPPQHPSLIRALC